MDPRRKVHGHGDRCVFTIVYLVFTCSTCLYCGTPESVVPTRVVGDVGTRWTTPGPVFVSVTL